VITAEIPVVRTTAAAPPPLGRRAWVEPVMGMPVSVHVRATEKTRPDIAAAVGRVFAHLRKADEVLSAWRADSDLLRLQHREVEPGEAHAWVADVTELCLLAEERTDGLFRAWRSRPSGRRYFDPTGLVKGWALAGAAAHLETVDEIAWSVVAGGDVLTGMGRLMAGAEPLWRVGIENPRDRHQVADVVTLTRGAVATSGAAARGAHVVDPATGLGIDRSGSATVVGPDLVWADIWATAAWVDPDRAASLIAHRDPAYRLILL
jgi:thiamine biosynthesis lipoprotein